MAGVTDVGFRSLAIDYGADYAAGEISAMKSSIVQCSFPNARRTSASVFWYISLVVSSHEYCLISSLNMAYSFRNAVSGDEADAIIPVAIPPNPAS